MFAALLQALSRNERMMHQRVWKMKTLSDQSAHSTHPISRQPYRATLNQSLSFVSSPLLSRDLVEPRTWQTRTDLQTYLGALAVMGRQKGGGRVFSKEKHSYFDHDDSHALQQAHSKGGNRAATDEGDDDDDEDSEARRDRGGKKAEQREEEKLQQEEEHRQPVHDDEDDVMEDEAEFSVPLGASADISGYISERLQSRQRERTIDVSAPPIAQHPTAYSTRTSVMLGPAHSSFLSMDEHKEHFSPRRSVVAPHARSGASTPRLDASQHPSPHFHPMPPRSPSAPTPLRLQHPSTALLQRHWTPRHCHSSPPSTSTTASRCASCTTRAASSWCGARAAVVEGKNLFAGLKDKFHNTFTEIREMAEEDREEKRREDRALNKQRKKGEGQQQYSGAGASEPATQHVAALQPGGSTTQPASTVPLPR